jgi:DNA-binding Lrp family transcriptional regulator
MAEWTFVTNHAAVLACIARNGRITAREIAALAGITERSVHRIIADLEAEGYVTRVREGRINQYSVDTGLSLRLRGHPHGPLSDLLAVLSAIKPLETPPPQGQT